MSGGPLLLATMIRQLHSPRYFRQGGNHAEAECVECEQVWPCATEQAVRTWEAIPEAAPPPFWAESGGAVTATVVTGTDAPQRWATCTLMDPHGPHDWTDELHRTWKCGGRPR